MIALPTFAPMALEQTYQQFHDVLAFNDTEKWITGEIGLFLNSLEVLDLNQLDKCIKTLNRGGINDVYQKGLNQWESKLNHFTDESMNTLSLSLGVERDHNDDERQKLRLCVTSSSYAYDIKPLSYLRELDRNVVVRCVAEIRAIFLYCPNVTDLTDFAGYRTETYEFLDEWLPANVKAAGVTAIEEYLEVNQFDCEAYGYDHEKELVLDYVEYLKPFPKWVSEMNKGIGKSDPFSALKRLKRLQGKADHPDVNTLLNNTICSIAEFLQNFPDLKSWSDYIQTCADLNDGIETDNPCVEVGYMLAWGEEGLWWEIQKEHFKQMMSASEQPTFYGWAYGKYADVSKLSAEKIYKGAALLLQMAMLSTKIHQYLPEFQNMDNEVKENSK